MSINFRLNIDSDTLRVAAWGRDENLAQVEEYGMAVLSAAISNNCTRAIIDESGLEYRLGKIDTFELANFYSEKVPQMAKVAIVCNPLYTDDAVFLETVAVNRGLQFRVFFNKQDAEHWVSHEA